MSKTIVVVGATGAQGGSVARTFLQFPGWRVRGITRNPSGEAAQALAALGVEIVQGELDDKQSLVQAFEGATVIFSNTDFFNHFFHVMNPENLPAGRTPGEYAYDREVEQGMNIAEAAESPSVLKTLERFVFSNLSDARKWSGGKYTTVYHFDSKAEMIRLTRERCPGVAAKMSSIQMGHYVTNWKFFPKLAPQKQPDGNFLLERTSSPTFRMPHFVTERDTGAFVKASIDLPPGKDILAVSEYLTFPEWAEVWGRVHGVKVEYKQVSGDVFWAGLPESLKVEFRDSFDYIEDYGFTGGDPDVLDPEQVRSAPRIDMSSVNIPQIDFKIPVTSVEEYIRGEDWSPILNPSASS
ncbi:hypothetical protein G7Z17_g993 [Cylindrodendrum hubeiense]|uniref:NmrA-like domain-containing protein n=1 Tax=Cylindrodendrum hubeiense TaxID=595255 RepID=A0A9P5LKI2_9HYPO|nr:hypothetical protein G7Z17_g993 [Cylindrodendrum hubeiense]